MHWTKAGPWFATKDTISKIYDLDLRIFSDILIVNIRSLRTVIEYFYTIDDVVKGDALGGFIWACKNYDGDVMSDMVSASEVLP